jgi:hypothetical protein
MKSHLKTEARQETEVGKISVKLVGINISMKASRRSG